MSDECMQVVAGASRRALFLGAGAVGATAVLAACGTEPPSSGPGPVPETGGSDPGTSTTGPAEQGETGQDEGSEDGGAAEVLVSTGEVEVGGGVIIAEATVVVTQPSEGTFKGFSAACTHLGCTVSSISEGLINCNCHGSQYSIEDGSVVTPAIAGQNPLPGVEINVDGDQITRA